MSSEIIRNATETIKKMPKYKQIDLMVKAGVMTPEQAEKAKQNIDAKWQEVLSERNKKNLREMKLYTTGEARDFDAYISSLITEHPEKTLNEILDLVFNNKPYRSIDEAWNV